MSIRKIARILVLQVGPQTSVSVLTALGQWLGILASDRYSPKRLR
jgi:hypothetical protein